MENLSWCLWKGCKLTCQFEESTKANDRGFTPYLWNATVLARNGILDPELARKENSQLREVYSDFTNCFSIRENIKMPPLTYRRFFCGGIQFHHYIQISEWSVGEAVRSKLKNEWWKVSSSTERSNIIRRDNQAQNTFERWYWHQ